MPFTLPYTFQYTGSSNLSTVNDYLTLAKTLIQDDDTIQYSQAKYLQALNMGLASGYRLRPDFFRGLDTPPQYSTGDLASDVNWPLQYAQALVSFITGWLELTDNEGNQEKRAAALIMSFNTQLVSMKT